MNLFLSIRMMFFFLLTIRNGSDEGRKRIELYISVQVTEKIRLLYRKMELPNYKQVEYYAYFASAFSRNSKLKNLFSTPQMEIGLDYSKPKAKWSQISGSN